MRIPSVHSVISRISWGCSTLWLPPSLNCRNAEASGLPQNPGMSGQGRCRRKRLTNRHSSWSEYYHGISLPSSVLGGLWKNRLSPGGAGEGRRESLLGWSASLLHESCLTESLERRGRKPKTLSVRYQRVFVLFLSRRSYRRLQPILGWPQSPCIALIGMHFRPDGVFGSHTPISVTVNALMLDCAHFTRPMAFSLSCLRDNGYRRPHRAEGALSLRQPLA